MMEAPECPICLQQYDSASIIPRVLHCGHTVCESCLASLPQSYPLVVRCPVCYQLVKFPSELGPASLPRNIELLRIIDSCPRIDRDRTQPFTRPQLTTRTRSWPAEFYEKWGKWILHSDAVSIVGKERFLNDKRVALLRVGEVKGKDCSIVNLDYTFSMLNAIHKMGEKESGELNFILGIGTNKNRCNSICGLWSDSGDGALYLVCDRLQSITMFEDLPTNDDALRSFAMIGMDMCEAIMSLHSEGAVAGCLSLDCFEADWLGRLSLSLNEVLVAGSECSDPVIGLLKKGIFLSPEMIQRMDGKSMVRDREVSCGEVRLMDVWALGCLLIRLFLGKKFVDDVNEWVDATTLECGDYRELYVGFAQKVKYLLQFILKEDLESLREMLCRCLEVDACDRPLVSDVWNCIRGLIIKRKCETLGLESTYNIDTGNRYKILAEFCILQDRKSKTCLANESSDRGERFGVNKDLCKGISDGNIVSKDMISHRDCITGLAVCGSYLLTTSYDKIVQVWSLQNYSHVHTFRGHNYKIMALSYVEEEEVCITGDGEGGIFFWSTKFPLHDEPIRKLYGKKDWRYSGIHALTAAKNGHLYTGNGDRSVKVWSLQDGTIKCSMDGHKSVVSSLVASNGVLYSGSWDGSIRLWSLSDHNLLTVLGETAPGVASVLSLKAVDNVLVATYESGLIKIWRNDVAEVSALSHVGSAYAVDMDAGMLFSGGLDKDVKIQEIAGDDLQIELRPVGSISGEAAVTSLLHWQGNLFVGFGDGTLKVYYNGG